MFGNRSRQAEVGDLIIKRPTDRGWATEKQIAAREAGERYIGIVHEVNHEERRCFITWCGEPPPRYRPRVGYLCVNIHNCRSEFELVKAR